MIIFNDGIVYDLVAVFQVILDQHISPLSGQTDSRSKEPLWFVAAELLTGKMSNIMTYFIRVDSKNAAQQSSLRN